MAKTILLADDSVTIQKVVELTFMDEDYRVQPVGNGSEAIEQLASAPDLVIADVHMPGADGYEVCRQAKAAHPTLPVLLLVGTFEPFDEARAREVGADAHLKKPFDSQDLLQLVAQLTGAPAGSPPPAIEADASAPEAPEVEAPDLGAAAAEAPAVETANVDTRPRPEVPALPIEAETAAPPSPPETSAEPPAAPAASAQAPAPPSPPADGGNGTGPLSDDDVERIARRVAELIGGSILREVAWEVVPDLAEVAIKERISVLESQVE